MTPRGILLALQLVVTTSGWSSQHSVPSKPLSTSLSSLPASPPEEDASSLNRRSFLFGTTAATVATSLVVLHPKAASAAAALTQDTALAQWKASVVTIDNLLENWDGVSSGGGSQKVTGISGDAIRKELGTANFGKEVSPLFQIEKAFKVLRENDNVDLIEFTELSEKFVEALSQADSMAYSANFAGGSGKPTPPKVYTDRARKEVEGLQQIAKELTSLL
ncbi:hypothetical protein ACHAXR_007744 [Thalassiosira sp. AJA248-18]